MTGQKIILCLVFVLFHIGVDSVSGGNGRKFPHDYRDQEMEFAGYAKPFTDKFLREINANSEAFKQLFNLANFESVPASNLDEKDAIFEHCRAIHRSQATELFLETGLIFQNTCLDAVRDLGPNVDKTVTGFLDELKKSSEDAHKEAVACSSGSNESRKGPEQLIDCLRAILDANNLPLHSTLDELSELYTQMTEVIRNIEICERKVVGIIEKEIENLTEVKIMKGCVNRHETIESYFETLTADWDLSVKEAVEYYSSTIGSLREGLENQMDVVLTRRPLRKMIKVIGKLLENEAGKMSDSILKRVDAIDDLDKEFDSCVLETPAKIRSLLDDSVSKLSHCGASVSNLQYEFDIGLASFVEKTQTIFTSINEETLRETCLYVSDGRTALEAEATVNCIKNDLISKIDDIIVPLEKSVAKFLYEQFLRYTNMEAHLTVKECIGGITKPMEEKCVEYMKVIQKCVSGNRDDKHDEKEEL